MNSNNKRDIKDLTSKINNKLSELKSLKKNEEAIDTLMDEIWELSKKRFVLNTTSNPSFNKYEGIIFTVGFSYQPIVLNILANNPKGVYFIYTKESEETIDRIFDETELKSSQCKREIIKKNSYESSMDLIGLGLLYLNKEKGIDVSKIGLDITGGTKIMSMACGVATMVFGPDGPDILYIDHELFDKDLRQPVPGTEVLMVIENVFRKTQDRLDPDLYR